MLCLITGTSLIGTSCKSCKTDESYIVRGEFHYVNSVGSPIELTLIGATDGTPRKEYTIGPRDSVLLQTDGETFEMTATAAAFRPPLTGDSTIIRFQDTLCYVETLGNGPVLQNIAAYDAQKTGDRTFRFRYVIDSALLRSASRCQ